MHKSISSTADSARRSAVLSNKNRKRASGGLQAEDSSAVDFRVVLYSHDTMGVGHMRRNLLIAQQIRRQFPRSSVLVIAGANEACSFSQSAGIDCLALPSFYKRLNGTYSSRNLRIPIEQMLAVRSQSILAAVQGYQPDLLIVDKVPAGACGELRPTLEWIREHSQCHCVLGLREILDTVETVSREWRDSDACEVIDQFYEEVWIYGDPHVFNAVEEYSFPIGLASRCFFTGYLDSRARLRKPEPFAAVEFPGPYTLCTIGGGQDGHELVFHFMDAIRRSSHLGVVLNGPHMPAEVRSRVHQQAANISNLHVVDFVSEGDHLLKNASRVITMGGYNTTTAVLSYRKPALIVPRVAPRQEQWIRAQRLSKLGLVDSIHPQYLTSRFIADWLSRTPSTPSSMDTGSSIDMNGLSRICELVHARFPAVTTDS